MRKNKKIVVIALLLLVVVGMGVGYSILSKQLKIEGSATIDTNYNIQITGIEKIFADSEHNVSLLTNNYTAPLGAGGFEPIENNPPTFTSSTANFDVTLKSGTVIAYLVTIENKGDVDGYIESVNINKTGAEAIKVEIPTNLENKFIGIGGKLQLVVIISLAQTEELTEGDISSNISIEVNTKQYTTSAPNSVVTGQTPYILWDTTKPKGTIKLVATSGAYISWFIKVNGEEVENNLITEENGSYVFDYSGLNNGDIVTIEFAEDSYGKAPQSGVGVQISNELKLNINNY